MPTGGRILFEGEDLARLSPAALRQLRARIQIVFQDPMASLNPRMSIHDIVAEPLNIWNRGTEAERSKQVAAVLDTVSPERLWRGSWARPTAGIETSPFGTLRTYNKKRRSRHMGLDLDGDTGDAIVAGNRGRVLMAVDRFYSGGTVVLDHGQGLITMAFHMSRIDVVAGQLVDKGELLGAIGASGQVTGPHLHFTVKLDGVSVDPKQLLALDLSADADDDKAAPLLTPAAHGPQPKPSPSPGQPPIAVPPPSSASSESSKTSVRNK